MNHPEMVTPISYDVAYIGDVELAAELLAIAIVVGIRRKAKGDTITEHWRWVDTVLSPGFRWLWRVFTAGMLGWALLHFLGGHA